VDGAANRAGRRDKDGNLAGSAPDGDGKETRGVSRLTGTKCCAAGRSRMPSPATAMTARRQAALMPRRRDRFRAGSRARRKDASGFEVARRRGRAHGGHQRCDMSDADRLVGLSGSTSLNQTTVGERSKN